MKRPCNEELVFNTQVNIWHAICKAITPEGQDVTHWHENLKKECAKYGSESLYHKWNESNSLTFWDEMVIIAEDVLE